MKVRDERLVQISGCAWNNTPRADVHEGIWMARELLVLREVVEAARSIVYWGGGAGFEGHPPWAALVEALANYAKATE